MQKGLFSFLVIFLSVCQGRTLSTVDMDAQLQKMLDQRKLMGMSVEITRAGATIYKGNFGLRDYDRKLPVENSTLFRMASLSKSITAAGLMLLYEKGKFQFTDDISKHLGFKAVNPNFPTVPITIEMVLSHQSSLLECSAYNNFLVDSYNAATGSQVLPLSSLFISGEKYFNACTFSKSHRPGSYFEYVNLNFVIAGTIIERLSGQRFDLYMRDNFLKEFSEAMNFNPAQLPVPNDLGVLYIGNAGSWQSDCDNYKGNIPQRNLTGYVIGSNGAVYGPQGSVRASVSDLIKYINIIRLKGLHEPTGKQLLQSSSVEQMTKWRYQFKGANYGMEDDFHAYGTGLFTTTYRTNDVQNIWPHMTVVGHTGQAYGLISAYFYHGVYAVAYVVNGALNGYKTNSTSIFEVERQLIHNLTYQFVYTL